MKTVNDKLFETDIIMPLRGSIMYGTYIYNHIIINILKAESEEYEKLRKLL